MAVKTLFWRHKTLAQMTEQEWESLCDGCGKCCLHKVIDDDTDELYFTEIACRLLDSHSCACSNYADRFSQVDDCVKVTLDDIESFHWLPPTCAYRRLAEGQDLPKWHPLITGTSETMHQLGHSVRGKTVLEEDAGPTLAEHIVWWPLDEEGNGSTVVEED
ncbi:YcgN family cysteine cluster protein [Corallincola spongiicola]|uniref:UPF0260 protein EXY25_05120 n=1 Tax=Corallincola spongiicola TaxID=2520508 RepID=A0ABY1WV39_9GAMM|nr:YcgN family cysteine cluster protein [Corallincola spongiicola]TAA48603.1 YcgN family cysteine cluster protein [Corallincola spongiicola]